MPNFYGYGLTGDDIAEVIYWSVERPAQVNINRVEIMPVCRSFEPMVIIRN
jgi:NADP-dependent 3-hydroxy acid dehydrogenase YdfG